MRILIVPDKFKHSLGADEVAQNLGAGLRESLPGAKVRLLPLADGGEGTADVIQRAVGGEWVKCEVHDAVGRTTLARYLFISDAAGRKVAVVEMSEAAGLARLRGEATDADRASTFGVGEMLLDAWAHGADEVVVGLGGSATNDGGFGMARALGFRFVSGEGEELSGNVSALRRLQQILPIGRQLPITRAAADVRNPLLGARGATVTFGVQKGATPEQLSELELALTQLADVAARDLDRDFRNVAGAGAAGGLGFGLMTFCDAKMESGFDLVSEMVGLEEAVKEADIVITGEGSLDRQTLEGKVAAGVSTVARKYGKRVVAVVGCAANDSPVRELFDDVIVLATPPITVQESIARCPELLRTAGRDLGASISASADR